MLALCGCNQFYGLDATKARDAAPDAHDRQVRLSMLVGPATDAASEGTPVLRPVSPDPQPRIALLENKLGPARYLEDDPSGIVPYPIEYVGKQWRLEYTPPDSVAHEVQWSPADTAGHLIVPVIGRTERTTVPANTGYILSMKLLSGTLYSFTPKTVIYTTGYWSSAASTVSTLTPKVDFSTAPSMSGPAGSPSATHKDVVVAVDYTPEGNCLVASRAGGAQATALEPGVMTSLALEVETGTEQLTPSFVGESPFDAQSRLKALVDARSGMQIQTEGKMVFGLLAHTLLPFTTSFDGVPAPLLVPIAECPVLGAAPPTPVFHLGGSLAFPKGSFVFVTNDRTVNNVRLRSSIAAIGRLTTTVYESTFAVAGTRSIKIDDLELLGDGESIGTRTELTLGFETATNLVVDYFEVTLYRLAGTTLEPVRTYVGPDPAKPTIHFDPSLLLPDTAYVFAVRTYRGRPGARTGEFQTVQGPQAVATIFSATFKR